MMIIGCEILLVINYHFLYLHINTKSNRSTDYPLLSAPFSGLYVDQLEAHLLVQEYLNQVTKLQ